MCRNIIPYYSNANPNNSYRVGLLQEGVIDIEFTALSSTATLGLGGDLPQAINIGGSTPEVAVSLSKLLFIQYPVMQQINPLLYSYRYGFNGKENDNSTSYQDYGMRMYNPALARFISPDPLIVQGQQYPELSSYQFASNTPIAAIDLDGLEAKIVIQQYLYVGPKYVGDDVNGMPMYDPNYLTNQFEIDNTNVEEYRKYSNVEKYGKRGTLTLTILYFEDYSVAAIAENGYKATTTDKIKDVYDKASSLFDGDNKQEGGIVLTSNNPVGSEEDRKAIHPSEYLNIDDLLLLIGSVNDGTGKRSMQMEKILEFLNGLNPTFDKVARAKEMVKEMKSVNIKVCNQCNKVLEKEEENSHPTLGEGTRDSTIYLPDKDEKP